MSGMLSLLRSFRDGVALTRERALWRMLTVFTVIKLAYFVAAFAFVWVALTHAAPGLFAGMDSSSMHMAVSDALLPIVWLQIIDFTAGVTLAGPYGNHGAARIYARTLMNLVEHQSGADEPGLIQAVRIEPSAGTVSETQTFGPLAHPMRALGMRSGAYIAAMLGAAVVVCLGAGMTALSLYTPPQQTLPVAPALWIQWLSVPGAFMLVGVGGALWALMTWRFARMERQALTATVDADGVTFRMAGRASYERRLRWRDARGFARLMIADDLGRGHEVFVLSGAEEDFLWEAMYASASASVQEAQGEEAWRVAAHQLAEQVAQRTGLTLLDLTPMISLTMATSTASTPQVVWGLFGRARVIARKQGDVTFARALTARLTQTLSSVVVPVVRLAMRFPNLQSLTAAQRDDTLRLARDLLPYYPTPAQLTPNPLRRFLMNSYVNSQFALQLFVLVLAIANLFIFALPIP